MTSESTPQTEKAQIGFRVTETIEGAKANLPEYPLLPGDLLAREPDGTWFKEAPGLGVGGFVLTEEQVATLTEVRYVMAGLSCTVLSGGVA